MEREWTTVTRRRRKHPAKSPPPYHHNHNPSPSNSYFPPLNFNRPISTSPSHHSPKEQNNPPTVTYYFTNFPSNWDHTVMLSVFRKYGCAIDVFIASKRNRLGKRFGFCSIKYIGGLNLLVQLPDKPTVTKALSSATLKQHFNSLKPWSNEFRILNRVTWISIGGLPPQLWFPDSFSNIAEHFGTILISEDCSPRQFNRTVGRICILTDRQELIMETLRIPFGKEILTVRVTEFEGEIDSLFNGYTLDSSEGDDDSYQHDINVEDECQKGNTGDEFDNESGSDSGDNQTKDDHEVNFSNRMPFLAKVGRRNVSEEVSEGNSHEGSTSSPKDVVNDNITLPLSAAMPGIDQDNVFCDLVEKSNDPKLHTCVVEPSPNPNKKYPSNSHIHFQSPNNSCPTGSPRRPNDTTSAQNSHNTKSSHKHNPTTHNRGRSLSVPASSSNPYRKKRFSSLKMFNPIHRIPQPRKTKKNQPKCKIPSQTSTRVSDSFSAGEGVAESSSLIRRCNFRILTKNSTPSNLDSSEVGNIIDIGNQLGFDMNNKDADVARILENGDHGDHKRSWTRRLIGENKVHFLGLQETMTRDIDRITLQAVWGNSNFEFVSKNSEGKSGGIISIWDPSKFTLRQFVDGEGFLAVSGTWHSPDTPCNIIVVYAPQCIHKKKKLWLDLTKLYLEFDSLTIIMGDFNEVRADSERLGTTFCHQGAINFNDFISSCGLFDLPLCGLRYTRINRTGSKLSKLDRYLVSPHYLNIWPNSFTLPLVREYSYHVPILLSNKNADFGPVPFKLYNSWLAHDEFRPIVLNSWASPPSKPFRNFALSFKEKLQNLKSGPWYQIARLKEDLIPNGINLSDLFSKKIGNGESTKFWLDKWMGGSPLNELYPRLFRLDLNQHCLVRDRAPTTINTPTVASVTVPADPGTAPVLAPRTLTLSQATNHPPPSPHAPIYHLVRPLLPPGFNIRSLGYLRTISSYSSAQPHQT
ncbi:cytochrome P450 [Artemisia annua]|uniref:Cytochrome P450 n=1 Tax=Artemisia annua TaxID=35608 RepID=A0A2U1PW08_ARTAN|nr:cytochrome P450 [Artemisia annua]